jgi:mono/diheme cytochrome c family protein
MRRYISCGLRLGKVAAQALACEGGARAPRGLKPALLCLFALAVLRAAPITADSTRGAALFETLSCIQCHSINGKGGTTGPDLGRRIDRDFTPASLAGTMWNHAPVMWAAMREQNVRAGDLNEQAANDLFAYFYSVRFFEKPGDAGRGKNLFASKHCADCHGLTQDKIPEAKPVSQWESVGSPIYLIATMWNHASAMRLETRFRGVKWPELTPQDLTDMLVYLRGLPEQRVAESPFFIDTGANGQALFQSKGCAACHMGKLDLVPLLRGMTLTDIAAAMWNHAPRMGGNPPQISTEETRELVSYLWARQFFEGEGNPSAGARVFASKHCVACHNDPSSGAPKLPKAGLTGGGGEFTAATMVSALWRHGPRMLDQMKSKGISWPRFSGTEMANLIAFLNRGK